jgi:hypothetical protein
MRWHPMKKEVSLIQKAHNTCYLVIIKVPKHSLKTNKIIKSRDIVFVEDRMIVGNNLEVHQGGSNEIPKVVGLDKSSKSPLVDKYKDIEEHD